MQKIYVAGHRGMVGGAICRQLAARQAAGADIELITRTSGELDLTDQAAVRDFFAAERPEALKVVLDPEGAPLETFSDSSPGSVVLITGPEGGLSEEECATLARQGFVRWRLGPRILRAETAPLAALATLSARFGDF